MNVLRYYCPQTWSYRVEIYAGDPPARIEPAAAVVIHAPESLHQREVYVFELLGSHGALLESLQFDTLEIALDQAHDLAHIPHSAWIATQYVLPDKWDQLTLSKLHPSNIE